MKKLISWVLSGAIVLIPVVTAAPVLADAGVSAETSVSNTATVNSTTGSTNSTDTTGSAIVVDSNGQTVTAGTLPDSPLYWFTSLIEKLQIALAFNPAKKADLVERQALVNLADAQELVKKGNQEEAQKALESYTNKISAAQEFLNLVKDPASAEGQVLIEALNKTQAANISVLTGLLDKLPPQAAQKIALNIVRSMEKAVAKKALTPTTAPTPTPTPAPTPTPDSTTTPVPVSNDPSQINPEQDKDQDNDKDKVKINKEIKSALEKLRHDLEQKETPNPASSTHPQLNQSSNEDHKDVISPKDSSKQQEGEKQHEQQKKQHN
ncbi:DUF5667 domain-containing protein [Desulfosporosinus sp. Sb-LF]|uniref:DUF5667 domain-containing protein n=1 Tax=Desulfosporosinus sp. Sb-LF TaxID=2560027 RepID=UPI00107FB148|nr:DUF5667 domain-containing protein [Desulfosporosinus sp. Sb-LF]TGE31685.1 hypothetical protein E4K68_15845 [Desulfosporosinus sp. Sb-LF]